MILLGIDPGESQSGVVLYSAVSKIVQCSKHMQNHELEVFLTYNCVADAIVCEDIVPMGVPFSSNLRATCRAIDRLELLAERRGIKFIRIRRNDVKTAMCGMCRGVKDANVAAGVQERFGGRKAAIGTKRQPGPCYGVSGHAWQALAAVIAAVEMEMVP